MVNINLIQRRKDVARISRYDAWQRRKIPLLDLTNASGVDSSPLRVVRTDKGFERAQTHRLIVDWWLVL